MAKEADKIMLEKQRKKPNLGRGLSSLLGDLDTSGKAAGRSAERSVPIELVKPNPRQPRDDFAPEALQELAESIKAKGVLQPLIVRPHADGYMIVAGERRWRAAQRAAIHEVPVIVKEYTESESLEIALIENIQRADLNPIEEANGYRQLMDQYGHTQEELAAGIGKSRSQVANVLRMLSLPTDVQEMVRSRKLTAGHARALVVAPNPSALARDVVNLRLSVRQTEDIVRKSQDGALSENVPKIRKDANTKVLETALSASLRAKVTINYSGKGESGKVVVGFKSLDQFEDLCRILQKVGANTEKGESVG